MFVETCAPFWSIFAKMITVYGCSNIEARTVMRGFTQLFLSNIMKYDKSDVE